MINIICAIDKNNGIGKNNKLLVHLPPDLQHFKDITKGHTVIMGRKTYDSIGKKLKNRDNVILSRKKDLEIDDCKVTDSLAWTTMIPGQKFYIGGEAIFKKVIKYADKIYLTIIDKEYNADRFFPEYDNFKLKSESDWFTYKGIRFKYLELINND